MRLVRLMLERFGHFSDKNFDFGQSAADKSDFHILYGRNEAGKTTIMEAWLRLLFGIRSGRAEHYAFKHGRQNLKIAAVLEENGKQRFFARAPQGHGSVLQDKNGAPLPDYDLQKFLPPALADEQKYRDLLCLDDRVIEQGGQEIIESKGEMGGLLFSAAAGLPDFSQQLKLLQEEADALHKPRARIAATKLADLTAAYEQIEQQLTEQVITAPRWQDLKRQAEQSLADEHETYQQRQAAADKIAALKSAEETESRIDSLQAEFAAIAAEMAAKLGQCGFAEEELTAADAAALYQKMLPFAISPPKLEELRAERAQRDKLAQKTRDVQAQCERAAEKCAAKAKEAADLRASLPPPAQKEQLSAAFSAYGARQLMQEYVLALGRQNDAKQRAQKALAELATVQGQHFAALPASPISAQDAARLAQTMRAAEAELEQAEKNERAAAAQLAQAKAKFAAPENARS